MLARRRVSISLKIAVSIKYVPLSGRQPQVHERSFMPHKQVEKLDQRCTFDLHFRSVRVIHVVTANITAKEKLKMTTLIPEENGTHAATASNKKPKTNKEPRVAPRRAKVAPVKPKSARKGTLAKKAPKARTKPEVAESPVARDGRKTAKILDLLKRPRAASSKELINATACLRPVVPA